MEELKETARIMFTNLNAVYALHNEEDGYCNHCSLLRGDKTDYPCPTVYLLMKDMKAENASN